MQNIALDELCNEIRLNKDKKVVLTFHTIGDRDAVGSAVALSEYFTHATVVTPDFITNNARRMLSYLGYTEKISAKFPKEADLIIVCDANNLFALGKLGNAIESNKFKKLFIDHHAPHVELKVDALAFNNESFNSTSSIVCEVMHRVGFKINKNAAILLLNGITADSADLQNSSPLAFRQIAELLEISKLDFSFFTEYFEENIPVKNKYQVIKEISAAKVEIVGKYILIYGEATEHANVVADNALKLQADASVFWVKSNAEASISARLRPSLDKELSMHLGVMMESIGKIVGGNGGGHACAAGAYGPNREAASKAGEEIVKRIKEKMMQK